MKKKLLIFTGAGIDKESGIATFRDTNDGLWNNFKIKDVATPNGWRLDKEKVLDFYNLRRRELKTVQPNLAHKIIAELENDFDVTVVTQNVTDLHERAGSSKVIHLHGELTKARSTQNQYLVYDWHEDINIGDKCDLGSQLRPHIVWFSEMLDIHDIGQAKLAAKECDICIIVGTSMQVSPANEIPFITKENTPIIYIDKGEADFYIPEFRQHLFEHIKEVATVGMEKIKEILYKNI